MNFMSVNSRRMFDQLNVRQLRVICKFRKIKYSKLKKVGLVQTLASHYTVMKIQRFLRSRWIDGPCPISMEPVKYPCFAYRPKGWIMDNGGAHFIYYNLKPLIDFLISSGDFRDPKTREAYDEHNLQKIDTYAKRVSLKTKSVLQASKNRNFYKRKRDRENDIIVIERCIDEVTSSIRHLMENESLTDPSISLNSFLFPVFHRYFRNLTLLSRDHARYLLDRTIHSIVGNERRTPPDPNKLRDFILQFLLTMETTYL